MKQLNIFDGILNNKYDSIRLGKQARIIFGLMSDRHWRTLHQIHILTGYPTTSISAQLRNFRKEKFGSHTVRSRRTTKEGGTYEYQLIINQETVKLIET